MTRAHPLAETRAWERRAIPLNCILGRSPANCRPDGYDDDVDGLAASYLAMGRFLNPLLVAPAPGPLLHFHVHAGGRRLAALRALAAAGQLAADAAIDCEVFTGTEGLAREISLAENIMRRDLHPVDQCAAFAAMIGTGMSIDAIAADFAITTRQVRQRLKLQALSPAVRAAWREGRLTTEAAQAFTIAVSHEEQDALLKELAEEPWWEDDPREIRARLRGEAKRGDCAEALYVGLDAYAAAGGDVDDNLFEDHPLILDGALLARLAREKMMREGEAILAETGFAFCMIAKDVEYSWRWPRVEPAFLPAEKERLAEIEQIAINSEPGGPGETDKLLQRLEAEEEAIRARALDRACTPEMRAKAGIFLDLAEDGTLEVERGGLQPPASKDAGTATGRSATASGAGGAPQPAPQKSADPIETAGAGRGMVRTILEATIHTALVQVVGNRPDLALLFMVARYGGTYAPEHLTRDFGLAPDNRHKDLLGRVQGKPFDSAIALCADAPLADLTASFARIVAGSIRLTGHALLASLDPLMAALAARGAALRPAFVAAMDYERYFEAATRQAAIAALEAMDAAPIDRQAKKPALAAFAADEAKRTQWLPSPLAGWAKAADKAADEADRLPDAGDPGGADSVATLAEANLATAMGGALAAEDARNRAFDAWLAAQGREDGAQIKASNAYAAYAASARPDALSVMAFGKAIAAAGIEKRRFADGWRYLGLRLSTTSDQPTKE